MFERLRDAGKLELPDEELSLALFQATRELTYARSLPAYEVSNHARPGGESRHNLIYWRYGEYAGVGPGAHGRLVTAKGRLAQETERHPEMWLTLVETEGHGLVENVPLSREEQGDEFLLMGLRLSEGVDPRAFEKVSGRPIDPERIRSLVEDGFLERDERGRIRVTAMGAPLLDTVVADVCVAATRQTQRASRVEHQLFRDRDARAPWTPSLQHACRGVAGDCETAARIST